ncbi:MAG: HAD hydrolase-like protein [Acidimicrobiia bacterium]|nr:HAD hydrolase-like protein [Acidimicrobiia bacterium]
MHVVWDWNGTLLDDLEVVVESVNRGLAGFGVGPIDLDGYRTHYTRPVKLFYDRLFGRPITDQEWTDLDRIFHSAYLELLSGARLTTDAARALANVRARGHTQSLLSMFPHVELMPLIERLAVASFFHRIDGLAGPPGDRKAAYLDRHLRLLTEGEDPTTVVVIGDTPDDAEAAFHVGAHCVLYDGGSHHRTDLEAVGVPVGGTLVEAVEVALSRSNSGRSE